MTKVRKSRIKNCIILNPPTTPEEQEAFNRRIAKALALALYRALSPTEYERLIRALAQNERMEVSS